MKTELLIKQGYKYQIGFWSQSGNYQRLAVTKYKPSTSKITRIAKQNNCPIDRLQTQILQG
jgi:hypothetical protein